VRFGQIQQVLGRASLHTASGIHRHRFVVCLDRSVRARPTHCVYAASFHVRVGLQRRRSARCVSHVAVLQKSYDIVGVKATLAVPLMEES
jgi:hypothetical protein